MQRDVEPVRCDCGETLLDGMDDSHVVVGEDEFRFRRTTDFVGCARCGTIYRIADLHPGMNEPGEQGPLAAIDDPLEELRKLADEMAAAQPATPEPDEGGVA